MKLNLLNGQGMDQQTTAAKLAASSMSPKSSGRRSRRAPSPRARAQKARPAARRARRNGKPARLVKGSAAAKRYMASIRRKRK